MMETQVRKAMRRLGRRSDADVLSGCPVCGKPVTSAEEGVRAWPGIYAHRSCGTYARRGQRRGRASSSRSHLFHRPATAA